MTVPLLCNPQLKLTNSNRTNSTSVKPNSTRVPIHQVISLINANKMENTHTHKIMTFNGEDGMFPMYHVKFTAVVYGMGSKYFNALNGIAPYNTCSYNPIQAGRTPMRSVKFGDTPHKSGDQVDGAQTDEEKLTADRSRAAIQASSEEVNRDYHDISRKVYSLLMTSLGMEPIKRLMNAGMMAGNGIGAWHLPERQQCEQAQSIH